MTGAGAGARTPGDIAGPAYFYDLARVRAAWGRLRQALPEHTCLYYSLKANPHPAVVGALHELGARAEVCSTGELAAAREAGVDGEALLFTGPGRTRHEAEAALAAGVRWFSVDSPRGLDVVDAAARSRGVAVRCLLRLNGGEVAPGHGLTMTGQASQFGADLSWVCAEPAAFRRPSGPVGARIAGLHVYQGTNLATNEAVLAQLEVAVRVCRTAADAVGIEPELVDLGGGFAAPFAAEGDLPRYTGLRGSMEPLLDEVFPCWRAGRPRVAFESGRYLVATCGELVTPIADVKTSYGRRVVVLESGINHLGGMAGLRRVPPLSPRLVGPTGSDEDVETLVTGPLCTPLDMWHRRAALPPVAPGDLVRVPNVGAYGLSASLLAFLGHEAPEEVVHDGGRVVDRSRLVLRREPTGTTPPDTEPRRSKPSSDRRTHAGTTH